MDGYTSFLLLAILATILPTSLAVPCYVCSWSPDDADNRTDWCSTGHFEPKVVYIHECELGCETYVQWDKNEALEHWRRNCVQPDTPMTGDCVTEDKVGWVWRLCTCNTDYCNSAIYRQPTPLLIFLVSAFFFISARKSLH